MQVIRNWLPLCRPLCIGGSERLDAMPPALTPTMNRRDVVAALLLTVIICDVEAGMSCQTVALSWQNRH